MFVWKNGKNIFWAILMLVFHTVSGQKTDKVLLMNGDVLTGEIKNMRLAMLKFDLDGPGIINIKWEKVKAIRSDKVFEIVLRSGEVIVSKPDSLFFDQYKLIPDDIVDMVPIRNKFLKRLYGDFSVGFNYTKSTDIVQLNFNGTFGYRIPKLEVYLRANSFITKESKDSSGISSREQDINLASSKYFNNHLFAGAGVALQQNTELGLANRFLFSSVIGRDLVRNNHNWLLAAAGFAINNEESIESSSYSTNADAVFSIQYKLYYYSSPKRSIDFSTNAYPSITDWGRVRLDFVLSTSIEVFKDFIAGINFYDKFDNRPPEGATSKNDYGITFSIGYKFHK